MIDPRLSEYETLHGCRFLGPLGSGSGQDGRVLHSNRLTAVKFFDYVSRFERELEIYHILRDKGIGLIAGHNVPRFLADEESLLAIEMSIVERPFLLDFAGAKRPGEVPDFEQHVLDEHIERLRELFDDRWIDALHVAEMFRQVTGFVLLDLHPGNVAFVD
jgi:hypothetical protein